MGPNALALLGRILMAAIFIMSGVAKARDPAGTVAYVAHLHLPAPQAGYFVAVLVELAGGLAILIGFRTRSAAVILAAWCAVTAFLAHYHPGEREQMINFMKNLAMAGGFLQLAAWGPGKFSIDRR